MPYYSFYRILILLVLVPEALSVIVGIFRYKSLQAPLRYLLALVIVGLATDICLHVLSHLHINNHLVILLYIPVEFWLITCIYQQELKYPRLKRGMQALVAVFGIYTLCVWLLGRQSILNPLQRFLEGFFVLCFVLVYFYQTLKHLTTRHLERSPMFWLSAGLFIYFACDIIIFIFSNFVLSSYSEKFNFQLWAVHAILTIVLYLFYTLALWINPKK